MKKISLLFILIPCFCFSQTELVTNGTFATSLTSWIASGNVIYNNFYSNGCAAFSSADSPVTGIISQNITANAGETLTGTLNYGRRGDPGFVVEGLFEIINNVTSTTIYSTTLSPPSPSGTFINTTFTIVAPSNSLLIRFTDQTTYTVSRDFYFNTISITQPNPLPIELIDFDAKAIGKTVMLHWQTASEINNNYFTIERSLNGFDWEELRRIDGAGNSSNLLSYSTVDNSPYFGTSYYRLKQTDFDGQYDYSSAVTIDVETENNTLTIYPNPTIDQVIIEGDRKELEQIEIYNMLGQNVSNLAKMTFLDTKVEINLRKLASGNYIIKTRTTANKVYKQ